jgi:Saxitoxin biosynthesis operon protein SxtJ
MQWSDIPTGPTDRVLRQFAGMLAGLAVVLWYRGGSPLVLLGAIVGGAGLVRPALVRWLYVGWMMAVFPIGWVVSRVVLALVFFGVMLPLALALRVVGRDTLGLRGQTDAGSYWVKRQALTDARRYFCQY